MTKLKILDKSKNLINLFKSQNVSINIGAMGFLTSKTRVIFTQLKQAFIKMLIFQHFNLKCYIWIENNISGYIIAEVLNSLILDSWGQ